MIKTFLAITFGMIGCVMAEVTPEQGVDLACYIIGDDFTIFNLTTLMTESPEEDYDFKSGNTYLEMQFCRYLDHTTCFARTVSMSEGQNCLAEGSYLPTNFKILKDSDDDKKINGI